MVKGSLWIIMRRCTVNSFLQPHYLKLSCSLAVFGVIVYIPILFSLSLNHPNHLLASFLNAAVNIPIQTFIVYEHIFDHTTYKGSKPRDPKYKQRHLFEKILFIWMVDYFIDYVKGSSKKIEKFIGNILY